MPSISVTVIHQFQSRSGKTFRTFRTFRSAAGHTTRYTLREPDRALPQARPSQCARQPEGKVVTSRPTTL
jgi:hypothetical protein